MGAVPVSIANAPLDRIRAGSPTSPRILAARTKPMPWSVVRVVPDSLTLPAICFSTSAILLLSRRISPMRSRMRSARTERSARNSVSAAPWFFFELSLGILFS